MFEDDGLDESGETGEGIITPEPKEEPVTYEELKVEVPEREVPLDEYEGPKSYSEASEETEQKSDLKAVLEKLHPRYKDSRLNEVLQSAQAARIPPDNFIDKNFLIAMSRIEEHEPEDDIDFMGIISMVQDATSIGLEGRGRVEDLEVAGVAHEEEMEKLSKDLGL